MFVRVQLQRRVGLAMTTEHISIVDKLHCVERELAMRHHVYPKWVAQGRIEQAQADREIAIMEAIRADYRQGVDAEITRLKES